MYPYHNHNKKRIKNGELIYFEFVSNYKNIGECMLLHFKTAPFERPVRPKKYNEYFELISHIKRK